MRTTQPRQPARSFLFGHAPVSDSRSFCPGRGKAHRWPNARNAAQPMMRMRSRAMGSGLLPSASTSRRQVTIPDLSWTMRVLLLGLAPATALFAGVDARDIIRRAVAAEERNWKVARKYGFSERVDTRRLDPHGRPQTKDVKNYDVVLLEGSPYRRLAGRDDRPLPPSDEKKEQEQFARIIAERRTETVAQRTLRLKEYESRPEWLRDAWHELPEAFDFRLVAEEVRDGHSVYAIEATPRRGYQPLSRTAKTLAHLKGMLWVDQQDYHVVRAEAEVIETISVGLFLFRLAKGSRATFEQSRVNEDVWLPRQVRAFFSARLGLLKVLRIEHEIGYSRCREFPTDSPAISQMKAR